MSIDELRGMVRARPFRPFRIYIADGAMYDLRHPDQCLILARSVIIGLPSRPEVELYDNFAIVELLLITRMEPLPASAPSASQS